MDINNLMIFVAVLFAIFAVTVIFLVICLNKKDVYKRQFIPLALGLVGVALAVLWILATEGTDNIYMAVFVAITQGFLCAGASVYINQIIKQSKKAE